MLSKTAACLRAAAQLKPANVLWNAARAASSAELEVKNPYKFHRLEADIPTKFTVTKEEAEKYYTQMKAIRTMETASGNLYKEKAIRGFCHLYSGQEACCVGLNAAMRATDAVITSYRAHGWTYIRGIPFAGVLGELTGRKTGCAQGKGGSMHMYAPNFYGGNGIVGAQVPLGAGIALAMKYQGTDNVCFTLFGDGAANQGQVFESFNLAALWDLPVIFVVENNGFGMGTSVDRASASTEYYTRGDYVPGIWVDGMDVLAVKEATEWATGYVRSGKGPLVMECATYRYHGHSMSDPGTSYRTREQIQEVRTKRDPITGFKDRVIAAGLMTAEELKAIDDKVKKEVDEGVMHAKMDPEPSPEEMYSHVYSQPYPGFQVRGCDPFTYYTPK